MSPFIENGEKFIALKTLHIQRGDVVLYETGKTPSLNAKRIIGTEGDVVQIKKGMVYINGKQLNEDYLLTVRETCLSAKCSSDGLYEQGAVFEVPKDSYFVLGDNRKFSEDSRHWKDAYLKEKDIVGVIIFVFNGD